METKYNIGDHVIYLIKSSEIIVYTQTISSISIESNGIFYYAKEEEDGIPGMHERDLYPISEIDEALKEIKLQILRNSKKLITEVQDD